MILLLMSLLIWIGILILPFWFFMDDTPPIIKEIEKGNYRIVGDNGKGTNTNNSPKGKKVSKVESKEKTKSVCNKETSLW